MTARISVLDALGGGVEALRYGRRRASRGVSVLSVILIPFTSPDAAAAGLGSPVPLERSGATGESA